jgi:transposase-like protein
MRTGEEKVAIVAQTLAPGVSVAEVARQHAVNANLLFARRRLHGQGLLEAHTRPPRTLLLPIIALASARRSVIRRARPPRAAREDGRATRAPVARYIEIERPDEIRVWFHGPVELGVLAAVLASLAQR